MPNPYIPVLSAQRQDIFALYKRNCKLLGNFITREMSLYELMDEHPSIIESLQKDEIDGVGLFHELYTKYSDQNNRDAIENYRDLVVSQKTQASRSRDLDGEAWKGLREDKDVPLIPDVDFLVSLTKELADPDNTLEIAVYNTFKNGARSTHDYGGSQNIVMQNGRSEIITRYLFDDENDFIPDYSGLTGDAEDELKTAPPNLLDFVKNNKDVINAGLLALGTYLGNAITQLDHAVNNDLKQTVLKIQVLLKACFLYPSALKNL